MYAEVFFLRGWDLCTYTYGRSAMLMLRHLHLVFLSRVDECSLHSVSCQVFDQGSKRIYMICIEESDFRV